MTATGADEGAFPPPRIATPLLRAARADDAPALAAVEARVFPHPWTEPQLASELRLPSALGLVLQTGGDAASAATAAPGGIVGFALFRRLLDEAELLRLAVLPAWRRRGLAGELVARGSEVLRALGVASAFLEVRADNTGAIRFYEQGGWSLAGHRARYYPDGADALLYRRTL